MRVFDAYGTRQSASLDVGALVQELPNYNCTQAFILLGVPEGERAQFIAEIDVESMSTRELQKAISERSQAIKERDQALQEKTDLRKALDEQGSQITRLATERDNLKTKAEELSKSQSELESKSGRLQLELISIKKSTSYEAVQRMGNNLTAAYIKASANKLAFLFESLDRTFKELKWELSEFAARDPDTHEVYKNKVIDFLTRGLKEKI